MKMTRKQAADEAKKIIELAKKDKIPLRKKRAAEK